MVPWVYQRVLPQQHLHLLLHHLHHRITYLMSTDTPRIQYQREVEVRVRSYGETRCTNPQKPKTKIKMRYAKMYEEDISHESPDWLQEFRENLVDESTSREPWGNQSKEVKTLPSHLMNFQWSREQKWNRVRVSTVYILTFRKIRIVTSA